MADRETLSVYAEKAQEYATLTDEATAKDAMLGRFISQMPRGGIVLDLGCGPGASAAVMSTAGLKVHAWDPVPEMVALAAARPGVTARQAGFGDVNADAIYDGVWANFSLLHVPRPLWPGHLETIKCALRPNGLVHVAIKLGEGEERDKIGRFYAYETEIGLFSLLAEAGMTPEETAHGRDIGLSGEMADWIAVQARA